MRRRQALAYFSSIGLAGCLTFTDDTSVDPNTTSAETATTSTQTSRTTKNTQTTSTPSPPDTVDGSWPSLHQNAANTDTLELESSGSKLFKVWRIDTDVSFKWRSLLLSDEYLYILPDRKPQIHRIAARDGQHNTFQINQKSYSPAILEGTIVLGGDSIRAFSTSTGKQLWTTELDHYLDVIGVEDGVVYTYTDTGSVDSQAIFALDVESGKKIWSHKPNDTIARPAVKDGKIFYNMYGTRRAYAYDIKSADRIWRSKRLPDEPEGHGDEPAVTARDNKVLFPTDGKEVFALSVEDGRELWRVRANTSLKGIAVDQQSVYIADVGGSVISVDIDSGQERWKLDRELGEVVARPSITQNMVYIPDRNGLQILNSQTGERITSHEMLRPPKSAIVPTKTMAFVSDGAGIIGFVMD